MATSPPSPVPWLLLLISSFALISFTSASKFSLAVSGPTMLQLTPTVIVENSPGVKPGVKVKSERVMVQGLPRINNLDKFASSVKINVSFLHPRGRPANVEVCFHRNLSLGLGMCPQGQWERLNKGMWVKSMSPFDHKILDIRMAASFSESLVVSLYEEHFMYRVCFLVLGIVLMSMSSWISQSLVFYYSGAMAVGVFLVILMILFQGMKLLPTGNKSLLAIFLYSCTVGFGSFLLSYLPSLLQSLLTELGLSEEMYNPMATFLFVFVVIAGACLGFWVVHKLVRTKEGSVDVDVAYFVAWSIRIVATLMILQSTTDPLLAIGALPGGIIISLVLKRYINPKAVHHVYKKLHETETVRPRRAADPYASPVNISRYFTRPHTPVQCSSSTSPPQLSDTFYSSFHATPDRKNLSKNEWDTFTKESTRRALEGLVSSPDFNRWAVTHADRITLTPKKENVEKRRRWFGWF